MADWKKIAKADLKKRAFWNKRSIPEYTFDFSLQTHFRRQLYGVILYKGRVDEREHVAVELYSGHVRLSVDLGDAPGSALYSQVPVNDGGSHKVSCVLEGLAAGCERSRRWLVFERRGVSLWWKISPVVVLASCFKLMTRRCFYEFGP